MNTSAVESSSRDRVAAEPALAELVDRLTARLQDGEPIDLDAVAAQHPEYADRLRQLLPALEVLADLGRSATHEGAPAGPAPPVEPGVLGDYQIVREVGRGGMGVVYEARQISLNRRVALKVLPFAAALDPRQLQRFLNEAQAAAGLHHTHIVPVFAVGVERGVHYYAMQFIEGRPLSEVIRALRPLDLREPPERATPDNAASEPPTALLSSGSSPTGRPFFQAVARLGIQAAEALEYAHSLGVVHRDIKPANLLLDTRGEVWVTDFGLARIQAEGGLTLTLTGDVLGTLRYMSPEQALGRREMVDHRSDIYSLGVTLYELLTLQPAVVGGDRQEILRRIAFEEPAPPSRINPEIPRDLETVLLKSIAKEPESRYATAQDLADDLERFLGHKPIKAKRPNHWERVVKWGRRHPSVVISSLAVLFLAVVGLTAGIILTNRERGKALAQQRRAETHLRQAREAVDQMLTEVGQDTLSQVPQMEPVRRALLEKALGFYEKFLTQESDDPVIQLEAGRAYRRVGDIRWKLGQHDHANEAYQSAIELLERLAASRPFDLDCRRELAESHVKRGGSLFETGRTAEAERDCVRAIELRQEVLSSGNPDDRLEWAGAQHALGTFLMKTGRLEEARKYDQRARDTLNRLVAEFPDVPRYQSTLAGSLNVLALVAFNQRNLAEARTLLEQATARSQAAVRLDPRNPLDRLAASGHQEMLALTLFQLGERSEAERLLHQCISIGEALVSDFPSVPKYRDDLAGSYGNLASMLRGMGPDRREEAARVYDQAAKLFQALMAEYPTVPDFRMSLGRLRHNQGLLLHDADRLTDSERSFREAIDIGEGMVSAEPNNVAYKREVANWKENLAMLLTLHSNTPVYDPARAIQLDREAIKLFPENAAYWKTLSEAYYRTGNWKASVDAMEQAIARGGAGELDPSDRFVLAMARWRLGEKDAARNAFNEATAQMAKSSSHDESFLPYRDEAAALLGLTKQTPPTGPKEENAQKRPRQ